MQIRRDDRGATAVEYGVYVALVAAAILGGVILLNGALGVVFTGVAADPVIGGGTSTTAAVPAPSSPAPSSPAPSSPAPSSPAPSSPAPSSPAPATTAPGVARALAASSPAKGKVTVTWDAPASDGGSAVRGYDVEIDDHDGGDTCASPFSSASAQKVLSTTTSFTQVPGTATCIRVRAFNDKDGEWVQLGPVSVTALTAPGVPRSVTATSTARESLQVTWEAPEDGGGASVSYDVDWEKVDDSDTGCDSSEFGRPDRSSQGLSGLSATEKGFEDDEWHCVRVRATSDAGEGNWVYVGPVLAGPSKPATVTGLKGVAESGKVALTWSAPADGGSAISGYRIERASVSKSSSTCPTSKSGEWKSLRSDTESAATAYDVSDGKGDPADSWACYRVSAINGEGTGQASSAVGPLKKAN